MKKFTIILLLSIFVFATCGADWIVNRHEEIVDACNTDEEN